MKKLFVLMLVLGTASTAGAALTIRVSPDPCTVAYTDKDFHCMSLGETVYIGVYNDTQEEPGNTWAFLSYMEFDSSETDPPGEFTGSYYIYRPPAVPQGGNMGITFYGYTATYAVDWLKSNMENGNPGDYTGVGVVFAVEFRYLETCEDVEVRLMDDYYSEIDSIIITVPEPMSIVLLGLGGLFLRRRK